MIPIDDFKKIELKVAKVIEAEKVEGSDKLLKLEVDFGFETTKIPAEKEGGEEREEQKPIKRQIIAGLAQFYAPEALIGKECPFAFNLASRKLAGLESQGMILCPSNTRPYLLHPDIEVDPGTNIK